MLSHLFHQFGPDDEAIMCCDNGSEAFSEYAKLLMFPAVIQGQRITGSVRQTHIPKLQRQFPLAVTQVEETNS